MNGKFFLWHRDRSRMRDQYSVAIFWIVLFVIAVAGAY